VDLSAIAKSALTAKEPGKQLKNRVAIVAVKDA
jgi:hypothetical protein